MKKLALLFALMAYFCFTGCETEPTGGDIKGSYWNLSKYKSGSTVGAPNEGMNITATFTTNKVSGISTCNRYSANYSTNGASISIKDLSATERACDAMNVEQVYLDVLSKATGYSVTENGLVIHAPNGWLEYERMSEKEIGDIQYAEGVGKLITMFSEKETDPSHHFYPIIRVDRPGNYPYTGKMIDPTFYQYFDKRTSSVWDGGGGDVLAIGKFKEFYVCRVPGRYVSSDIALFQLDKGALKHRETIAWAWCDEGWCNQQDAWLQDIDKDGLTDIVQRYTLTDDQGKVREERMTILLQDENGNFNQTEKYEVDKSSYPMADI